MTPQEPGEKNGHLGAEAQALKEINSKLSAAAERMGDLEPERFEDQEDYWRAARAISEAGSIVVHEESRRRIDL